MRLSLRDGFRQVVVSYGCLYVHTNTHARVFNTLSILQFLFDYDSLHGLTVLICVFVNY